MIVTITTTNDLPSKNTSIIGMVQGSAVVSAKDIKDMDPLIRQHTKGGEAGLFQKIMEDARKLATERMIRNAEKEKAKAIINVRIAYSGTLMDMMEVVVYGTAVYIF